MSKESVLKLLEEIGELQADNLFLLVGIYLPEEYLALLRDSLEPDEPKVGAVGRFQRTPIYSDRTPLNLSGGVLQETHQGINYTYGKMDHIFAAAKK